MKKIKITLALAASAAMFSTAAYAGNTANLTQEGEDHVATIVQTGSDNNVDSFQGGVGNGLTISQTGDNNDAWTSQYGTNNALESIVDGDSNLVRINQGSAADGNAVSGNIASANIDGDNNTVDVWQDGDNNVSFNSITGNDTTISVE